MCAVEEKRRLRRWEIALLLGLAVSLLMGDYLSGQGKALSEQVVRLHVVGASDAARDQEIKLQVRDAVLAKAEPWLEGVSDAREAAAVLEAHLPELARAGAETAGVPVRAAIEENSWFPTRDYPGFSLPAGRYTSLRITVGEGKGRNWWCVVYPALCTAGVTRAAGAGAPALSEAQVSLITEDSRGYEIKFKAVELWNGLARRLDRRDAG